MIRKCRVVVFFVLIAASSGVTWAGDGGFNGLPLGIDLPNPVDGSETGYVRIADDDALEPQRFTIEAWIYPEGPGYGHDPVIIAKPMEWSSGSYIFSWMMIWQPNGQIWAWVTNVLGSNTAGSNFLSGGTVISSRLAHR